ncbi:MAG: hypothetical protein WCB92_18550, partial [Mycobacterium sp.]
MTFWLNDRRRLRLGLSCRAFRVEMESCATGNLASITQSTPGTRTRLGHFQGLCGEDAKAEMWPVSVDFGGVQAAHEVQDLPT